MKKLRLSNMVPPDPSSHYTRDKKYWVWLGNGVKRSFTNKKHADAFLVKLSKYMNEKIAEMNLIYAGLFTEYRLTWFYIDPNVSDGMDQRLIYINSIFSKLGNRWNNSDINTLNNFKLLIEDLKGFATPILKALLAKNDYAAKHRIEISIARLTRIESDVLMFLDCINEDWK